MPVMTFLLKFDICLEKEMQGEPVHAFFGKIFFYADNLPHVTKAGLFCYLKIFKALITPNWQLTFLLLPTSEGV